MKAIISHGVGCVPESLRPNSQNKEICNRLVVSGASSLHASHRMLAGYRAPPSAHLHLIFAISSTVNIPEFSSTSKTSTS